jgi:tetratricopeptide (TPR) repeat protein
LKRELKKQIKQDELLSGFEHAAAFYREHRGLLGKAGAALLVVVVLAWGVSSWVERRRDQAELEFAAAMEILNAPVAAEVADAVSRPAGTVYATAREKYTKAAAAFDGVERKYASLAIAGRARYYSAVARLQAGDTAAAEELLTDVASRQDEDRIEPALARLSLGDLYRRSGQPDKAVEAYKKVVDETASPLPRDHALMALASTLEEAKRFAEAKQSYRRLAQEFPSSVYAGEARRRAEYLETAGG